MFSSLEKPELLSYFLTWRKQLWPGFGLEAETTAQATDTRKKRNPCCHQHHWSDPEEQKTTLENIMHKFKTTISRQGLSLEDYAKAEQAMISCVQGQRFKDEIALLKAAIHVKKDSQLYKLDPVWEYRVLRVGDCLSRAATPEQTKHPGILSQDLCFHTYSAPHPSTARTWRKESHVPSQGKILDNKCQLRCKEHHIQMYHMQTLQRKVC